MISLRRVRSLRAADAYPFRLHLFRSTAGTVCGWFIGPLSLSGDSIEMPYLPRSANTLAAVAIVRAMAAANADNLALCIVDPENLWVPLEQLL